MLCKHCYTNPNLKLFNYSLKQKYNIKCWFILYDNMTKYSSVNIYLYISLQIQFKWIYLDIIEEYFVMSYNINQP